MILRIIKNKKLGNNYFSLILEKPKGFDFYPGQYLDIELPVKDKFGKTRAFTIASSPTEDFLMITPQIGRTPFKKFMEKIKTGDTISASYPAGTFTLDESSPAFFIAGGIGITPFRSMVKYVLDRKISTPIILIYSSSKEFAFKKELDIWQKQLPNLTIHYLDTNKEDRLNRRKLLKAISDKQSLRSNDLKLDTIYYLAGSHSLVDNLEDILLNLEIDQINIRTDRFDGYE